MSKPTGPFPRRSNLPDPSAPCPDDSLTASTRNLTNLAEPDYWAAICPELSVNGKLKGAKPLKKPADFQKDAKQQINDNGVVQLTPGDMHWTVDVHSLARNMVLLMQHGWPATFMLMFDEVWALIHRASALMAATTGNACNMDVLCWYVDPNQGAAGFSPHRDRQPEDSPATFRPADGSPMYGTCWVPLTDACPENSCLYMVPRWADPGYFKGDDDDGPDPLLVALAAKENFQAIRALPAEAGSAIIFTHRIIHWGSRGRKGFHTPRLAVSWGCADDAYEPPYFSRAHLPYPPMALRAALACGQMLVYHERFAMTKRQLSLYYKFFTAHASEFHVSYRDKVASEFVAATKELVGAAVAPAAAPAPAPAAEVGKEGEEAKLELTGAGDNSKGTDGAAGGKADNVNGGKEGAKDASEGKKKTRCAEDGVVAGANGAGAPSGGKSAAATAKGSSGGGDAGVGGGDGGLARDGEEGSRAAKKAKRAAADAAGGGNVAAGKGDAVATANAVNGLRAAPKQAAEAEGSKIDEEKDTKKENEGSGGAEEPRAADGGKGKAPDGAGSKGAAKGQKAKGRGAAGTADGNHPESELLEDALEEEMLVAAVSGNDLGHDDLDEADEGGLGLAGASAGDANDDDEDEDEEGPGWEGLLGPGSGGDSEDDVMEDALDAMLDAELAGRGDALQDDYDDDV